MPGMIYAEVAAGYDSIPSFVSTGVTRRKRGAKCCAPLPPKLKLGSHVTLVANTHRTAIRIAELTARGKRLTNAAKWRLVEENFPLGPLMNANTHIFDGSVFENSTGRRCFMMATLPKTIAEPTGELALEMWGNAHKLARLDTVEHMVFRHFAFTPKARNKRIRIEENPAPLWVVLPQGEGFRILHINDGLPQGAYYISNHPDLREAELQRAWETAIPQRVVMLTRTQTSKPPQDAWIKEHIQGRGLPVENKDLCCMVTLT